MFVGDRAALNVSANQAGYRARCRRSSSSPGIPRAAGSPPRPARAPSTTAPSEDLLGVVMFDGVSRPPVFTDQLQTLIDAGIPDYQIAAPPQSWNAWGVATEAMLAEYPDQFFGVQIDAGSHTDVIGGDSLFGWLGEIGSDLIVRPSPPGRQGGGAHLRHRLDQRPLQRQRPDRPALRHLRQPQRRHLRGQPADRDGRGRGHHAARAAAGGRQPVRRAPGTSRAASSSSSPSAWSTPRRSTRLNPDGSIKVENSGNYFGPNGPPSNITGAAVPVNARPTPGSTSASSSASPTPTSRATTGSWTTRPTTAGRSSATRAGLSGYILTRDQIFTEDEYNALVARA